MENIQSEIFDDFQVITIDGITKEDVVEAIWHNQKVRRAFIFALLKEVIILLVAILTFSCSAILCMFFMQHALSYFTCTVLASLSMLAFSLSVRCIDNDVQAIREIRDENKMWESIISLIDQLQTEGDKKCVE